MARTLLIALLLATPLLAAPTPPEEKPKPRAKLLGTVKLDKIVIEVCWTPDAKHLILITDEKGLVIGRDQIGEDAPIKPIAEFALPVGGTCKFGMTPDGTELYAMVTARRINAETRLCYWTLKDLLDGKKKAKPDRVVSLEVDKPSTFALSADGRSLYTVVSEPRRGGLLQPNGLRPQIGKVLRSSTKTGDIAEEWMPLDLPNATLVGAAVHTVSGKVFAHFQTAEEHVVRCFDRAGKKEKWERTFPQPLPNGNVGDGPKVSPDGRVVVAYWSRQFSTVQPGAVPQPGQPPPLVAVYTNCPQLLNATNGEVIADLGGDDVYNSEVIDFSPDGKLMFGWLKRNGGLESVLWETKSGKPLKTWNRGSGDLTAAFAPGRHELAIVEHTTHNSNPSHLTPERIHGGILMETDGADLQYIRNVFRQQRVPRVEEESIIGVWDLAPLVK